jgi:glycosyltransferase involved in cell wall biosynthesis
MTDAAKTDGGKGLICLSHLRWDFVYQRPQHLLSRFAQEREVIFFEEPRFATNGASSLDVSQPLDGLTRIVPLLSESLSPLEMYSEQGRLLERFITGNGMISYDLWYYTPMGLRVTTSLTPELVVFDCMDELSGFLGAPPELKELERRLLDAADVVFTGGASLFEAKRTQHPNVHCCPSSIDREHFAQALNGVNEPDDQGEIKGRKVGFYGVIDERFDTELLRAVAALRPDIQFVLVGPVVKIDEGILPRASNIHFLGKKSYQELPAYLSGWDVAILPFARNAATRFISPTKTPEYLAAGRPVVSTSIRDVVNPYGQMGVISIADSADDFAQAIDRESSRRSDPTWQRQVADLLATTSWDSTWKYISSAMESCRK